MHTLTDQNTRNATDPIVYMTVAELQAMLAGTISEVLKANVHAVDKAVMTSKEAAAYLGFTEDVIRRWRANGTGPRYVKRQNRVRYMLQDINAWLAKNTKETIESI